MTPNEMFEMTGNGGRLRTYDMGEMICDGPQHPIDPYLSPTQRMLYTTAQKDELVDRQLRDGEKKVVPVPPKRPAEPSVEDVELVPYHPHTWSEEEVENGYYMDRVCTTCESYESDTDENAYDCWRIIAEERNHDREVAYRKALERHEAQMDYWLSITGKTR